MSMNESLLGAEAKAAPPSSAPYSIQAGGAPAVAAQAVPAEMERGVLPGTLRVGGFQLLTLLAYPLSADPNESVAVALTTRAPSPSSAATSSSTPPRHLHPAAAHSSRIGSWWLSIWSRILALSESVCTETDAEHGPLSAVT